MENKEPSVSEESVNSPCVRSSSALESNADSTAGVSPRNSIEWQDQAYNQLLLVKEKYGEDIRRAYQCAEELQPCSAEEHAEREKSINDIKKMVRFLLTPKSCFAHCSKQEFSHGLSVILEHIEKLKEAYPSAARGSQPSLTSQWLNTNTHQLRGNNIHTSRLEDSRGRHVSRNQSQYQNVVHSNSEARQITPCSENMFHLANVGILPNFNAQNSFQQGDVRTLPPLSSMDSLRNWSSTGVQVNSFPREMESAINLTMTHLTPDPTTILSDFVRQQDNHQIMQPHGVMPHQVHSYCLNFPSALESNAGVFRTNSIEWQDRAYNELILVREQYVEDLKRALQSVQKLQLPVTFEECALQEMFERLIAFLWMPKSFLAYLPKEDFCYELSIIVEYFRNISSQPSQSSQWLNTTTHHQLGGDSIHTSSQDSRGRHVTGHQSHYQNVAPSYSEAREITPAPRDSLTGTGATQSSFNNMFQRSLTSGPPCTEIMSHMVNAGVLPNFNAQRNFQQEAVCPLPPLYRMVSLQNCSSTGMQVNSFPRTMESSTNLTMSRLPAIPTPIFSQSIRQQDNHPIMQPQMVMPHQVQRLADNNQVNQPIGRNRLNYLSRQEILPTVSCPDPILSQLIREQNNRQIMQPPMVMPYQVQRPAHNNQLNQPVGQNRQNYLSSQGIWMQLQNYSNTRRQLNSLFREMESRTNLTMNRLPSPPAPILSQVIRQQDQMMQSQMVMPHQVRRLAHNDQVNQPIGQNWQNYLICQGILPTVSRPDLIFSQLIRQQDIRQIMQPQMATPHQVQRPAHNNQLNQPIGQNWQNYLSSLGIWTTVPCPDPFLPQFIRQQDYRQIMQPHIVMQHQVQRSAHNNQLNQPIGQNRQNYLSSQGIRPVISQDCTSLAATADDYVTSTALEPQYFHMTNTDGARNASHESDPNPATKKQKLKFPELLFEEIERLNRRLLETEVNFFYQETDSTPETEVLLEFTYIPAGQKQVPGLNASLMLPNLVLQLQMIVHSDYPCSSPVIVSTNPRSLRGNDQEKALWDETLQKFDRALHTLPQPISVEQMAEAWDSSAREAYREYVEKLGGGSVSS